MHHLADGKRQQLRDDNGAQLGVSVAEVMDAIGESARLRLEHIERRLLSAARVSGVQGMGVLAAAWFLCIAWLCGAGALAWWLHDLVGGPVALAAVGGLHAVVGAMTLSAVAVHARRRGLP